MSRRFEISWNSLDEENQNHRRKEAKCLYEKLNFVLENNFKRVSYTEAIDILRDCTPIKEKIQLYH
jgi:asparaginyl-tRNA synthetase